MEGWDDQVGYLRAVGRWWRTLNRVRAVLEKWTGSPDDFAELVAIMERGGFPVEKLPVVVGPDPRD